MKHVIALALVIVSLAPLRASPSQPVPADPGILAPIDAFANAFNAGWQGGSTALPSDLFTDDIAIIDLFAPYYWHGKREAIKWYASIMPEHGDLGLHQRVTLGIPQVWDISENGKRSSTGTGDLAYVVVPTDLSYVSGGKLQTVRGLWAWALRRSHGKWLVAAHSWSTVSETKPPAPTYTTKAPWLSGETH